jgi:hypothetical protein
MARLLGLHPTTLAKYARERRVPLSFVHEMGKRYRWRADFADDPTFLAVPDLAAEG